MTTAVQENLHSNVQTVVNKSGIKSEKVIRGWAVSEVGQWIQNVFDLQWNIKSGA